MSDPWFKLVDGPVPRAPERQAVGATTSNVIQVLSRLMFVPPRFSRLASVITLAVSVILASASCRGAEEVAADVSDQIKDRAAARSERIIAIPDVATRATEVGDFIRSSNAKLASGAAIKSIGESLPNTARLIELEASMTTQLLQQRPTLDSMERQQLLWQQRQIVATNWLNTLTERASLLQEVLNRLVELNQTWTATRAAARVANAPEPILQQIDDTLTAIAATKAQRQLQSTTVLDLQARVAARGPHVAMS